MHETRTRDRRNAATREDHADLSEMNRARRSDAFNRIFRFLKVRVQFVP